MNSVGMELVEVPAGSFWMGTDSALAPPSERPRHRVEITRPFFIGKLEVTQEQWYAVMHELPATLKKKGKALPVTNVSWDEVQGFLVALNNREGVAGQYRLPTEAEWEYAARAGTETLWPFSDDPDPSLVSSHAWFGGNAAGEVHEAGRRSPNAWGLHDVLGNVAEWCQDYWAEGAYRGPGPFRDPRGPGEASAVASVKALRGGGWSSDALGIRPAYRATSGVAFNRYPDVGFRVVSEIPRTPAADEAPAGADVPALAARGVAQAQVKMGYACESGAPGIPKSAEAAFAWYRKAAEQGHVLAQFEVGRCYEYGIGVAKDVAQAMPWYLKSAEQGFAWAQRMVGTKYWVGEGVAVNHAEALRWSLKAAEQGVREAQFDVGLAYQNGEGGARQDPKHAAEWVGRAAGQGDARAQRNLGVSFVNGRGVAKDLAEGKRWLREAARQGDEKAKAVLQELGEGP